MPPYPPNPIPNSVSLELVPKPPFNVLSSFPSLLSRAELLVHSVNFVCKPPPVQRNAVMNIGPKSTLGHRPLVHFASQLFDTHPRHIRLCSLLLDLFGASQIDAVHLAGIEHAICVSTAPAPPSLTSTSTSTDTNETRTGWARRGRILMWMRWMPHVRGRVHVARQDLGKLQTRKTRALKRARGDADDEDE
ncbi:rRNA-binding ribosome biosynthesis protein rpf2 [Ceratobasidium sp. 414]|nr:rRNA-binding ribosome biosynthesis protein rpf2 [Ceratobasidium sp. 414]